MTEQSVILVTGGTGNVGRQVVSQLLGTGVAVRALTRSPDSAGLPGGVEVVRGDLAAPDTLDAGLDGADAVFLVWPFLTAEAAPAVLDIVAQQARRVVLLSSMGVRDDVDKQADPINQFHADLERLIEKSGLEWTFLRCHSFATNALWWAPQIRADGVVREPYGAAARPVIHERDIAAVAARVLTGDGHSGATYRLTGPQVLTQVEQVHAIGEAIGRPLRFEEISPEAGRQKMLAAGWPVSVVDGLLNAYADMATEPVPATTTVQEITGAPARTFGEWAIDHADDFR
ncbi:MAG: NAD(P)H-binding protein [Pseudonocardiaceae bacterium]